MILEKGKRPRLSPAAEINIMTKREKIKLIQSVFWYLQRQVAEAFETKDEANFDWYSDGEEVFFQILSNKPIKVTPRVKPL